MATQQGKSEISYVEFSENQETISTDLTIILKWNKKLVVGS